MTRRLLPALLALVGLAYLGGSWYFSNFIVAPDRRSPEADRLQLEADWGPMALPVEPEAMRLPVTGGELVGVYLAHPEPAGCALILLHGLGGTRWGGLRFLPLYWERGCDVLAPDLRGHGLSTAEWVTHGARERADVLGLVDWLVEEKGHHRERIGLHGVSMGGSVALLTAALEPELAFVAADSTFASLERIVVERGVAQYGGAIHLMVPGAFAIGGWRASFEVGSVSPAAAVGQLLLPAFLLHPETDAFTSADHTRSLAEQLKPERGVAHITQWGAAHGSAVFVNPDGYRALIDAFLDEQVPGFGRAPGALLEEVLVDEDLDAGEAPAEEAPAEGAP